ncbi:MAG: glycerol kinase GlpK [Kiritimatiellae bacterium]|nr:glycerol kinase GlpK [Kiritimatiellia bacterium]
MSLRESLSFVVALDQGTTSSRAVVFDAHCRPVAASQREFQQHYPRPGWVEHDPLELWHSQQAVLAAALRKAGIEPRRLAAIGIANQRETTLVWERRTGRPIARAIVWQDRRTAPICDRLRADGLAGAIRRRTGLVIDPYFSGTKLKWLLDHTPGARARARRGELLFGTVDTWLIWQLTGGVVHATDASNAARTMLFDIRRQCWDRELLAALDIPPAMLPEVRDSAGQFGHWQWRGARIPIMGVAGDQQAALFGQGCTAPGMAKNTYGTGCFLLLNTGNRPSAKPANLLATVAWRLGGNVTYALEGSVLVAGAAVQWLRDGLRIIAAAPESERLARQAGAAEEVYVVPAFAGLGAPYWDMYARGAIFGLTRGADRAQIVKATLESLAFQTRDVLEAMQSGTGVRLRRLRVDGGAAANDFLMQFQADILGVRVERPPLLETTALGAARLAGLAVGMWPLKSPCTVPAGRMRVFTPRASVRWRERRYARWRDAVARTRGWLVDER